MDIIDKANEIIEAHDRQLIDARISEEDDRRVAEINAFSVCAGTLDELRELGSLEPEEVDQIEAVLSGAILRARQNVRPVRVPGIEAISVIGGSTIGSNIYATEEPQVVWGKVVDPENDPEDNKD